MGTTPCRVPRVVNYVQALKFSHPSCDDPLDTCAKQSARQTGIHTICYSTTFRLSQVLRQSSQIYRDAVSTPILSGECYQPSLLYTQHLQHFAAHVAKWCERRLTVLTVRHRVAERMGCSNKTDSPKHEHGRCHSNSRLGFSADFGHWSRHYLWLFCPSPSSAAIKLDLIWLLYTNT